MTASGCSHLQTLVASNLPNATASVDTFDGDEYCVLGILH